MKSATGGMLAGVAAWAAAPAPLVAHGGHGGAHEGLLGIFHPIVESGSVSVAVALIGIIAATAMVLAGRRSKA